MLENGQRTSDPTLIGSAAVEHYKDIFSERVSNPPDDSLSCFSECITDDTNLNIVRSPDPEEIFEAIREARQDSAPGPDGFSARFYLYFWDVIQHDICQAVNGFFQGLQLPRDWSTTSIALVPKSESTNSIGDFRPISLCNVCHKIIARILSKWLSNLLPSFISEEQSGFVKGRNIHTNIALAHDLSHDLNRKSKNGGNVMIKLDLSKAYDRVSWSMIIRVMRKLGFCEKWCDLVYRSLSNVWYNVLWDGRQFGYFKAMRGVRQGDPLSPALFTMTMEWMSRSLKSMMEDKSIHEFYTKRGAMNISHLMFADDLLIFTNDNLQSGQNLIKLLDDFCSISGEKLNHSKSQIFFGKHTPEDRKRHLLDLLKFKESKLPVMYLGVPLFRGRVRIEHFDGMIAKMERKICGWARNLLSMAGRITLAKAVLQSMSLHVLTAVPVPKAVVRRINSLVGNFIWNMGPQKKHHWISMDRMCRDITCGGLGLVPIANKMIGLRGKLASENPSGVAIAAISSRLGVSGFAATPLSLRLIMASS